VRLPSEGQSEFHLNASLQDSLVEKGSIESGRRPKGYRGIASSWLSNESRKAGIMGNIGALDVLSLKGDMFE